MKRTAYVHVPVDEYESLAMTAEVLSCLYEVGAVDLSKDKKARKMAKDNIRAREKQLI